MALLGVFSILSMQFVMGQAGTPNRYCISEI